MNQSARSAVPPAGLSSPGDCYAEDRSRAPPGAYPRRGGGGVAVGGRAEGRLPRRHARQAGGWWSDDQTARNPAKRQRGEVVRAVIVALLQAWRANAVGCGNGGMRYIAWVLLQHLATLQARGKIKGYTRRA